MYLRDYLNANWNAALMPKTSGVTHHACYPEQVNSENIYSQLVASFWTATFSSCPCVSQYAFSKGNGNTLPKCLGTVNQERGPVKALASHRGLYRRCVSYFGGTARSKIEGLNVAFCTNPTSVNPCLLRNSWGLGGLFFFFWRPPLVFLLVLF